MNRKSDAEHLQVSSKALQNNQALRTKCALQIIQVKIIIKFKWLFAKLSRKYQSV